MNETQLGLLRGQAELNNEGNIKSSPQDSIKMIAPLCPCGDTSHFTVACRL